MMKQIVFFGLIVAISAAPFPQQDFQFHAEQRIKAQQFALSQPILPQVPGLDAHFAAEAQVLAAQGN